MRTVEHPPLPLQATVGQPLAIVLDAAPGAGLLWQAPAAPDGCTLHADGTEPGGSGEGGSVRQRFRFTAVAAGAYLLRFELRREWEATVHAVQPVQVTAG